MISNRTIHNWNKVPVALQSSKRSTKPIQTDFAVFTNDPPRPLLQRIFYRSTQIFVMLLFKVILRLQTRNVDRFPLSGGTLICPNHLSNYDPLVVGCISTRRVSFLAKKALFKFKPMGWLLYAVDCIPIDREATGIGGMKETLRRLKQQESVMLFPEGERSFDGEMLPMMTGFTALVKRVKVPMVPVGIHGTHEAWPRGQALPWFGRVKVVVGHPIEFSEVESMSEQEMADFLGGRLGQCYREARDWNTRKS